MTGNLLFDPIVPVWLLIALAGLSALAVSVALWRGLNGWGFRGLAGLVILAALAGPVLQTENRAPLSDIVLMLVDQSASQRLDDRGERTEAAAAAMAARLGARDNTEVRRVDVADGLNDAGTEMMSALNEALAQEPRGRVAGVVAEWLCWGWGHWQRFVRSSCLLWEVTGQCNIWEG